MELKRFFVDKNSLIGDIITLTDVEHNHLSNVLRLKVGDFAVVVMGDGYDYKCEITEINKKCSTLKVVDKQVNIYDPKVNVTVFQCIIKGDNMPLVVQKLNELGVATLVPVTSKFTVALGSKNLITKLQATANQSVKQCKRSKPIKIEDILTLKQIVNSFKDFDLVILANEREDATTMQVAISNANKPQNVAVIIGSEGGFDLDEIEFLVSNGAKSITMGHRILRAETASIALTSALMCLLGEWEL